MNISFPSHWIKFLFIKKAFNYKSNSLIIGKKMIENLKKEQTPILLRDNHSTPRWTCCSAPGPHPWQHMGITWEAFKGWSLGHTPRDSDFIVRPSVLFTGGSRDPEIQGKLGSPALGPFQCVNPLPAHRHMHTTQTRPGTHVYTVSGILLYFLLFSLNNILGVVSIVNKSVLVFQCVI